MVCPAMLQWKDVKSLTIVTEMYLIEIKMETTSMTAEISYPVTALHTSYAKGRWNWEIKSESELIQNDSKLDRTISQK